MSEIIMFYGRECPHCHVMMPLVDRLAKEEGVNVTKLEVWHSRENAEKMRQYQAVITGACGGEFGVPAFLDKGKSKALCGEVPYEELREWAKQ